MSSSSTPRSALYLGRVRHRRGGPTSHAFSYRMWSVLLDLDELPRLVNRIPILSHNRLNLLSFDDRDHMRPVAGNVRGKLAGWFAERGVDPPDGPVLLLTTLRHLTHVFNPVSFYYCYSANGRLCHVVAEVNSTFGETYCYLLEAPDGDRVDGHTADKVLHVSPFQPMQGRYRFFVSRPDDRLSVHIEVERGGEVAFDATLTSRRRPLSSRTLLGAMLGHIHLPARTLVLIHLQAMRLWIKGAPFHRKPDLPRAAWRTRHD